MQYGCPQREPMTPTPDLLAFLTNSPDPRLLHAADLLDRQARAITKLVALIDNGLKLQDRLLDEILRHYRTSHEPLPSDLIDAKVAYDMAMKEVTGERQ